MLEIILVRHGQTEWNATEKFRGRLDILLNETGMKQAELLGNYLVEEKIDIVYSSPLKRAVDTAKVIADRQNLEVNAIENINEINFGDWQGVSREEVKTSYPELYRDWRDTPEQVRMPGGESLEEVRARAMPFIEDAIMRCGEGKLVFVSHRVVVKVIICALLGLDNSHFWNFRIDTGGLTRFVLSDGRLVLTRHNDTSYLLSSAVTGGRDF